MNKHQIQRVDQLRRIQQFVLDYPIVPPILRATALFAVVDTLHASLLDHGSGQEGGGNTYRSGSSQRQALRESILATVTEISGTAASLDPAEHPGVRDLFRLNNARGSYQRLVNTGSAFLGELESPTVKAIFTDRGYDANFDVALTAQLTAFAAATGIKFQGRQSQKSGTVGLDEANRRTPVVVRELRGIVVKHLGTTNPTLVPVWKAAARAYVPAVIPPEPPPVESGAVSTPTAGS